MSVNTFFLTEVKNTGVLSAVGNFGLRPLRYLVDGKTFEVVEKRDPTTGKDESKLIRKTPKSHIKPESESAILRVLKTTAAIILLAPGLILSVAKLLSYASADVRHYNSEVKDELTPITYRPRGDSEPLTLTNGSDVRQAFDLSLQKGDFNYPPMDAFILTGDDNFLLDTEDFDYKQLKLANPQKVVLVRCNFKPNEFETTPLGQFLRKNPKWDTNLHFVNTEAEALQASLPRQGWFTCKRVHAVFVVDPTHVKK